MATSYALLSWTIQDADGNEKSFREYVSFDDATATLTTIKAAIDSRAAALNGVTDGMITSQSVTLYLPLTSGLKPEPAAGSNVEETALFTFNTDQPTGKVFSLDVPAVHQSVMTGKEVNPGATGASNFITTVTATGGTLRDLDDKFSYHLISFKRGVKKFRK